MVAKEEEAALDGAPISPANDLDGEPIRDETGTAEDIDGVARKCPLTPAALTSIHCEVR